MCVVVCVCFVCQVPKAKISSISSIVEVNEEGTVKERRMEGMKEAQGGEGEIVEEEEAGTRKTIKGCGDVWAAHAALQQARCACVYVCVRACRR